LPPLYYHTLGALTFDWLSTTLQPAKNQCRQFPQLEFLSLNPSYAQGGGNCVHKVFELHIYLLRIYRKVVLAVEV